MYLIKLTTILIFIGCLEMLILGSQEIKEFRFAKGKVCPHCSAETVSSNGKYKEKQRYLRKSCTRTFTDFTNSAAYKSNRFKVARTKICIISYFNLKIIL